MGEIGRVHGVRFVESTLAPVTRGSANGGDTSSAGVSSIAYGTVIFGKGFYGVTELDGGIKTFTVTGPTNVKLVHIQVIVYCESSKLQGSPERVICNQARKGRLRDYNEDVLNKDDGIVRSLQECRVNINEVRSARTARYLWLESKYRL